MAKKRTTGSSRSTGPNRAGRGASAPAGGDGLDLRTATVIRWAEDWIQQSQGGMALRVASFAVSDADAEVALDLDLLGVLRDGGVDGGMPPGAASQLAFFLGCDAGAPDPVAVMLPIDIAVATPGIAGVRRDTGLLRHKGALVVARAHDGWEMARMWQPDPAARARRRYHRRPVSEDQRAVAVRQIPDWRAEGFQVDPWLEDALARAGVPGANRQVGLSREEVSGHGGRPERRFQVPTVVSRWEAFTRHTARLGVVAWHLLVPRPILGVQGSQVPGVRQRPIEDLVRSAWVSEDDQLSIVAHIPTCADLEHEVDVIVGAPGLTPQAKVFLALCAADNAAWRDEAHCARHAGRAALDCFEAAWSDAGGVTEWLERQWPVGARTLTDRSATNLMLAACAAAWAVLLDGRFEELDWRPGEHAQSLERAEHVRDWLLDRLQKRGETPARRLLRVQAREFKVLAAGVGERRPERWRLLVRESAAAPIVVARHGLLAAVSLYGFTTAVRLLRGDLRADAVEPGAVLGPLDELIAARILMAANAETTPSAVEALVNRARAVVPHAGWVLECANEARFACRRWTSGLFDDLEAEHKRRGLPEVSAERMLVAEALGRPREAVTSLRDLLTETRGTPHAPAADVVAALRRSGGAARPEVVQSLLQALPEDAPPAGPRLARSLYGGDVAQAIDRWRAALASRADELREAQAQREERLSAVLAAPPRPRRERPEVSAAGREGDLDQALAALRWRLDRPFFRDRDKLSLEAHAREALELVATGEDTLALPWLIALGEPNVGLVPALDELLYTGDGSAVAAALPRAERELARCLEAAWRAQTLRHLRVLLAELRGVDPHRSELTAGVVALQSAVASAATADQRTAIDRRITELRIALDQCAEVGEDPETAHSAEPDALMRTPDAALVRSRRDLDTPEWAITEGLRQVRLYNLSGGHRDLKKLRGPLGELWELRQSDRRRPVRVVYRLTPDGSEVVAILAKQNDAHQRRLLERISGWAAPG